MYEFTFDYSAYPNGDFMTFNASYKNYGNQTLLDVNINIRLINFRFKPVEIMMPSFWVPTPMEPISLTLYGKEIPIPSMKSSPETWP